MIKLFVMTSLRFVSFLIVFILLSTFAIESFASNLKVKKMLADFIYKVPSHFKASGEGTKLCLFGYDETVALIDREYDNVVLLDLEKDSSVSDCKLVYVAQDKTRTIRDVLDGFYEAKIPTISFNDNFIESGGMMHVSIGRRSIELAVNKERVKGASVVFDPLMSSILVN